MSTPFDAPSPFKHAEKMRKRLKLMLWGPTGSGKTTLALQFPNPVVIDLEGGTDLYGEAFNFDVIRAADADEAEAAVKWLHEQKHSYETVVVDPVTIFWAALQDRWGERFLRRKDPHSKGHKGEYYELQPSDWRYVKNDYKALMRDLNGLDMHTIVTAHEKVLYKGEGRDFMQKVGTTFDGEKSTEYMFDVVLRLHVTPSGKHFAHTIKDRSNMLPQTDWLTDIAVLEPLLESSASANSPMKAHLSEENPASAKPLLSAETIAKIVAGFNALGIEQEQLEDYLDRPLAKIVEAERPALQRLYKELKEDKDKLREFMERLNDREAATEDLTPPPGLELP